MADATRDALVAIATVVFLTLGFAASAAVTTRIVLGIALWAGTP